MSMKHYVVTYVHKKHGGQYGMYFDAGFNANQDQALAKFKKWHSKHGGKHHPFRVTAMQVGDWERIGQQTPLMFTVTVNGKNHMVYVEYWEHEHGFGFGEFRVKVYDELADECWSRFGGWMRDLGTEKECICTFTDYDGTSIVTHNFIQDAELLLKRMLYTDKVTLSVYAPWTNQIKPTEGEYVRS